MRSAAVWYRLPSGPSPGRDFVACFDGPESYGAARFVARLFPRLICHEGMPEYGSPRDLLLQKPGLDSNPRHHPRRVTHARHDISFEELCAPPQPARSSAPSTVAAHQRIFLRPRPKQRRASSSRKVLSARRAGPEGGQRGGTCPPRLGHIEHYDKRSFSLLAAADRLARAPRHPRTFNKREDAGHALICVRNGHVIGVAGQN